MHMPLPLQTLREGIEEHVSGVDMIEERDGRLEFTIMLGGVSDADWEATQRDIESFEDQYNVTAKPISGDAVHTTYRVVQE